VLALDPDRFAHEPRQDIAMRGERAIARAGQRLQQRLEDRRDQVVLGREVPVERRDVDAGGAGDRVDAHRQPVLAEGAGGRVDQERAIADGVLAGGAVGRCGRHVLEITAAHAAFP
jgi:hypothetical protein